MSGVKGTELVVVDTVGSAIVSGAAMLALLAIPAAAGLTYYAGKTVIQGGIAAGKATVKAAKAYEEYRRQQEILRQRMMEERRQRELDEIKQMIAPYSAILQKTAHQSLLKDFDCTKDISFLNTLQKGNYVQTLDSIIEIKQKIQRRIRFLLEQDVECQKMGVQIQTLQNEITQMASLFRKEPSLPDSKWLGQLEKFRAELQTLTLNSFYSFQNRWSNWKLDVAAKLKSVEVQTQARLELEAIRHKVPCTPEEAEKIDPMGYAQLQKLEQHVLNQTSVVQSANLQAILHDYQVAMERHLAVVLPELEKLNEQKQQQKAVYRKYAPKIAELENMLELAQTEIVKRWAEPDLVFLQNSIENLKKICKEGDASNIECDMESWRSQFESMLTSAGLKQRAEERRQYIVQSMKNVLPELGFNIQSIQSESDAKSNTIMKVVPAEDSGSHGRRRITISIPQEENGIVQYRFDGYHIEKSREKGQPIEKNDDGKKTVQNIAMALKPFGVLVSEPDWKGNPDKIQKGAKDLPDSSGPEEEMNWQSPEAKHMEMDW